MKYFTIIFLQLFNFFVTLLQAQNDITCGTKGFSETKSKTLKCSKRLGIINGKEALPHEFPFAASIGMLKNKSDNDPTVTYISECTAAVIHPRYLLTAAHCAHIQLYRNARAVLAAHNISSDAVTGETHKLTVPIAKIIKHPLYQVRNDSALFNDIALVKLVEPVSVSENPDLGIICVPPQADSLTGQFDEYVGNLSVVVGWGNTVEGNQKSASLVLQKLVDLPIVSTKWCQEMYKIENKTQANSLICTYTDGKDTCQGDSGGPLMLKINGQWTVVGVTSFGRGCARKGVPGAFAHVALYSDWIWETIKKEEEKNF